MSGIGSWKLKLRFKDKSKNVRGICSSVRYNTHLYCLAVQAGFYSNAVQCWVFVRRVAGSILNWDKRCSAFFHLLHRYKLFLTNTVSVSFVFKIIAATFALIVPF